MSKTKPFLISKKLVMEAYQRIKANKGAAGVDQQSLESFEANLKDNLYKDVKASPISAHIKSFCNFYSSKSSIVYLYYFCFLQPLSFLFRR